MWGFDINVVVSGPCQRKNFLAGNTMPYYSLISIAQFIHTAKIFFGVIHLIFLMLI